MVRAILDLHFISALPGRSAAVCGSRWVHMPVEGKRKRKPSEKGPTRQPLALAANTTTRAGPLPARPPAPLILGRCLWAPCFPESDFFMRTRACPQRASERASRPAGPPPSHPATQPASQREQEGWLARTFSVSPPRLADRGERRQAGPFILYYKIKAQH